MTRLPPDELVVDRRILLPELSATIYDVPLNATVGESGGDAAWLFASDGLARVGQREVLLGVLRESREGRAEYPQFPLWLFDLAFRYAERGSTVESGARTIIGTVGTDIEGRIAGFIYDGNPQPLRQLPRDVPPRAARAPLVAVPLFEVELQAAEQVGQARVLALLGQQARRFPYPWYFDRHRSPVIDDSEDVEQSFLSRVPVMSVPYLEAQLAGAELQILLPVDRGPALSDALKHAPEAAALLLRLARSADRIFVWGPGQEEPKAIWLRPNDERVPARSATAPIGGNFLVFVHGQIDPAVSVLEDGFGVMLPEHLWTRLLSAMDEGRPFTTRVAGPMVHHVSLRLTSNRHVSPLGEVTTIEDEFRTYVPSDAQRIQRRLRSLELSQVVLLSSTEDVAAAIDTEDLVLLVEDACALVDDELDNVTAAWNELVLRFDLAPNEGLSALLAVNGDLGSQARTQRLVNRLDRLSPPSSVRGRVRFELWLAPAG